MKRYVIWAILAVCAFCIVFGCGTACATGAYRDITAVCRLYIGPRFARVSALLDGNPLSAWDGGKSGQHLAERSGRKLAGTASGLYLLGEADGLG